jgi:hypothetical protein
MFNFLVHKNLANPPAEMNNLDKGRFISLSRSLFIIFVEKKLDENRELYSSKISSKEILCTREAFYNDERSYIKKRKAEKLRF